MWYVKLQFLFNNISVSLIFLFDPASSVSFLEFVTESAHDLINIWMTSTLTHLSSQSKIISSIN